MDILFLHGLESGPMGTKARWFSSRWKTVIPALPTPDFHACVQLAAQELAHHSPRLLVGSSYGGAIAQLLLERGDWRGPTLLIAPAGEKLGLSVHSPEGVPILVLHGDQDEVIPLQDSIRYCTAQSVSLQVIIGGDHRLNALLENGVMEAAVRRFLG